MIGDVIEGCFVEWRDVSSLEQSGGTLRKIENAKVKHVGPNLIEFVRQYNNRAVMKKLTGLNLVVRGPDGRDLVAAWRE